MYGARQVESSLLRCLIFVAVASCLFENVCESARILAVYPAPFFSHQITYHKFSVELARRGHEMVIFRPSTMDHEGLPNYTDIGLNYTCDHVTQFMHPQVGDGWSLWKEWGHASSQLTEIIFSNAEMQRIIKPDSKEHFDLIIVEYLNYYALHGLMLRFNAPVVGIASLSLNPCTYHLMGNPIPSVYTPDSYDFASHDFSFWRRLMNVYGNIRYRLIEYYDYRPQHQKILNKYFGPDAPDALSLAANVSLVLVNEYTALGYAKPSLPSLIRIGGIAMNNTKTGLDTELQHFLDGAVNGFVYFSMGSIAKSKDLPFQKLNTLKRTFADLPYKVLWKWELDTLPGKPENVFIAKWLPQTDVLAHPNIKVFIYQGGLHSTEEAISHSVPVIGFPMWFDQGFLIEKLVSMNVGKRMDFDSFSKDELKDAILELATDEGYKKRMMELRDVVNDQLETPMERAIWWTEYVIRHKGAPHLHTRVPHMAWYERELLDVLASVIAVTCCALFLTYKSVRYLVRKLICSQDAAEKIKFKTG